jgi:tetratricopeptide (TPR) repeat protein
MAAIAANRGQDGEAGAFYTRLLALDPVDTQAAAGMAALQRGDPDQAESRLKGVLAASPENGAALFALGNVYAQQARWPEAQLAYFRAVGSEPANAGYAFNLAVSLDKLNQKKLALDYYRRALQLAAKGGATVDAATTERRIRQLEQGVAPR